MTKIYWWLILTIRCFRWWFMWDLKVATLQKNTFPTLCFFFCNDCYLHSLHESLKQFNCLYQYIYIFLLIYFIVSARFWYNAVFRFIKATHLLYLAIIGLIKYAFLNLQYFFLSFFVKVKINCLPYTWWCPYCWCILMDIYECMNLEQQNCKKHFNSSYVVW